MSRNARKVSLVDAQLCARAFVRAIADSLRYHQIAALFHCKASFPWKKRTEWGIDEAAWSSVTERGIEPLSLFCHPRVIAEQPQLLLYYRTVALLSQKGLAKLIGANIAKIEAGGVERLDATAAENLATTVNSVISAVVSAGAEIEPQQLAGLQFAAAGATIQGSWNNAVGSEGDSAVRTILANHLADEILQIVWKDGSSSEYAEESHTDLLDRIAEVRLLRLNHGYHLQFSSEPDISLHDPRDLPVVAIEIKAGTDSAGALERLGAAMKSFDNDRNRNPRVKTVYVVRCMTPELRKRIDEGNPFDYTFGLSELLADDRTQRTFANLIVRTVVGRRSR